MQLTQFYNLLFSSNYISNLDRIALEKVVKIYPFFETAQHLLTKSLNQNNAPIYAYQLKKSAIIAKNRNILQQFIYQKTNENNRSNPLFSIIEKVEVQAAIEPSFYNDQITELNKNQHATDVSKTNIIYEIIKNTVPLQVPNQNAVNAEPIEHIEQVAVQKISEEIQKQNNSTEKERENHSDMLEKELNHSLVHSYVQASIENIQHKNSDLADYNPFTGWLKKISQPLSTSLQRNGQELHEYNIVETEKYQKLQNDEIINKIIDADPGKIKLNTKKFFSPLLNAKESLKENEHLVTETLAKIYAMQGNISKSIRAFEILSLKYPQKSTYFAAQIEKLKSNK